MKLPAAGWRLVLVILAALLCAVACGPGACAEDGAAFVARVGEETISRARFDADSRRAKVSALPEGPQRLQAEAAILERLVDDVVLGQAVAQDGVQVDSAAVDAALERLRGQVVGSGATFTDFLAQTGLDEAGLRGQIGRELAVREFVERRVTTRAVEAYWEKNRRELDGTLVRVSHVVLRPDLGRGEAALADCLARAAAIRGNILQGEKTFAEAARAHSAGPSRRRDGDVGFMPRRNAAHEEFAKQAFTLAKGDISQPFVTPFGVHIIQITDVQPGDRTLVSLRPQIEQAMAQQIVRDTVAEARRGTPVEYAPGVAHFDPATPIDGAQPRRVVVAGPPGKP
jgi:peptidyl-prolyl cis-trans isomerase SurA